MLAWRGMARQPQVAGLRSGAVSEAVLFRSGFESREPVWAGGMHRRVHRHQEATLKQHITYQGTLWPCLPGPILVPRERPEGLLRRAQRICR